MKNTAGSIFVRFLGVGIVLLLSVIVGLKSYSTQSSLATLALAGVIFLLNLSVVMGYTAAIVRNESMLSEEDAPDLAYYLGFSLTVASLAVSFITDVGLASNAAANSTLVKGSLAQFGSGLLATLIGLCSKIFISSRQAHLASNPEILYQEFRQEIKGFESALSTLTVTLDTSIKAACLSITESAESAANSIEKLSQRLKVSSDTISENLSVEKIAKPIAAFSNELLKLQEPAHDFRAEMATLVGSASAITKGFVELDTSIASVRNATLEEIKNIDGLVQTKSRLNELSRNSIDLLDEQNVTVTETNKQLARLKNSSSKTADSYELVGAASDKLLARSGELEEGLQTIHKSIQETAQRLAELVALTKDFGSAIKISGDSVEVLSVKSTAVNAALSGTSNALSEVSLKFNGVPEALDRTLASLNLLTNSLATTASSTDPLVHSLNKVNAPLNETSESAKSLHLAIAKLNQDVESLSRVIATSSN